MINQTLKVLVLQGCSFLIIDDVILYLMMEAHRQPAIM